MHSTVSNYPINGSFPILDDFIEMTHVTFRARFAQSNIGNSADKPGFKGTKHEPA
jgi:hypothetical protein